jgi:hypothetical protein
MLWFDAYGVCVLMECSWVVSLEIFGELGGCNIEKEAWCGMGRRNVKHKLLAITRWWWKSLKCGGAESWFVFVYFKKVTVARA